MVENGEGISTLEKLQGRRQALLEVARTLGAATDLEESLDQILVSSRDVMNCEVCSILLPEKNTGDLLIRSTRVEDGAIRIPQGEGISGTVFSTKKLVNLKDAQNDSRHYRPSGGLSGLVARALLSIPLLDGDRCLGVMQAINPWNGASFDQSDEEIFEAFGSLVSVTLIRLEAHKAVVSEAERRRDLALANEIQSSFLPAASDEVGGIKIESYYEPASEVGGDFYFWHALEDGSVLLGVGDVCGKGLAAALDMARGTTMISAISNLAMEMDLGKWVGELNGRLCSVMAPGRFIAATFALIHRDRRTVSACMAGAMPPYYLRKGKWVETDVCPMPALGIACTANFESVDFGTEGIDGLMLLTDGLLELRNNGGDVFEDRHFPELLLRLGEEGRESLSEVVGESRRKFGRELAYHDDATILLVTPATPPNAECVLNSCAENISVAREFVEAWAEHAGFEEKEVGMAVLGVDEVLTNICRHAYGCGGGPVWCRARMVGRKLRFELEHEGEGIAESDEIEIREPNGVELGGRGMFVIHSVFDEVVFEKAEEDERYRILLTKGL